MDKNRALFVLYLITLLIISSGLFFCIYSFNLNVKYMVLNTEIPGYIFGITAIFLGIRYFRALNKLKDAVDSQNTRFAWSNFKK